MKVTIWNDMTDRMVFKHEGTPSDCEAALRQSFPDVAAHSKDLNSVLHEIGRLPIYSVEVVP